MKLIITTNENKEKEIEAGCIALNKQGFTVKIGDKVMSHNYRKKTEITVSQKKGTTFVNAIKEDSDNPADYEQLVELIKIHFGQPIFGEEQFADTTKQCEIHDLKSDVFSAMIRSLGVGAIIISGPQGSGKTLSAKRLSHHLAHAGYEPTTYVDEGSGNLSETNYEKAHFNAVKHSTIIIVEQQHHEKEVRMIGSFHIDEDKEVKALVEEHVIEPFINGKVNVPEPDEFEANQDTTDTVGDVFIKFFNITAYLAHQNANAKGFWDQCNELSSIVSDRASHLSPMVKQLINSQCLDLMHSELSEATEALRGGGINGVMDDKIPDFLGAEAELADLVIRAMDLAKRNGWRLAEAIVAKMAMNSTRPPLHGKSH